MTHPFTSHNLAMHVLAVLLTVGFASGAGAGELKVLPESVELNRAGETHRLVALEYVDGLATGAPDEAVTFTSADESVVQVDADGVLRAAGDGETAVTASAGGRSVSIPVTVQGCGEVYEWHFATDIQPALTKLGCNAGACHGAAAGKNGFNLSLRGYDHDGDYNMITRAANGRRILLEDPKESLLLQKPTGGVPHGGGRLMRADSAEFRMIEEWLAQGAPAPSPDDKQVVRIETLPPNLRLETGKKQQLLVVAHYDDGTRADVTRWVKFDTTDDAVAVVNRDGLAETLGSGSAALTAWYSSKVAFTSVSVPFPEPVGEEIFASADRNNYIDDAILTQLRALNIPPSPPADDLEFARRAYLDAIGLPPTRDELVRFMLDPSEDKRAKLIGKLLERPEYVDLWTYKWSDLFLVTEKKLRSRQAVLAFNRYIRESVEDNKGWDRFAKEIITARGSNLENGAGNYFVMHKEITDLTETTSQAFLGMSVQCARCHNHPLEKWTQDQYFQFANLFAHVKLKNGDRGGETLVIDNPFGNVLHPIRKKPLNPAPLDGAPLPLDGDKDRRRHLAEWLASDQNPYFARAAINRVWAHFMGRGIVNPVDDLRLTNPPVNEELFAALERDFTENGYDVKRLIRTIMNSAAYQRSSKPFMGNERDEKHFSRYIIKRLPAEVILDAYSQVTEVPSKFPGYPEGWRAMQLPDSQAASYFLDAFGRPERVITCECERQSVPTLPQSLHLSNGDTLNEKLRAEGNVIDGYLSKNMPLEDILLDISLRTFGRAPTGEETDAIIETAGGASEWAAMERDDKRLLLEDILWAKLSSKEFLFNH